MHATCERYLHDLHSDALRSHVLHRVHQPVHHLSTDEAVRRQTFLLRQQLDACTARRNTNTHSREQSINATKR